MVRDDPNMGREDLKNGSRQGSGEIGKLEVPELSGLQRAK